MSGPLSQVEILPRMQTSGPDGIEGNMGSTLEPNAVQGPQWPPSGPGMVDIIQPWCVSSRSSEVTDKSPEKELVSLKNSTVEL